LCRTIRKNVEEKVREMSAEMENKLRRKVPERTGAVLLRLRVDHRCLKYKKKEKNK
jgi:hypothetical protein